MEKILAIRIVATLCCLGGLLTSSAQTAPPSPLATPQATRPSPFLPPALNGPGVATPQPLQPAPPIAAAPVPQPYPLICPLLSDAETKEVNAKVGEISAHFNFQLSNSAPHEIMVTAVRTSCGCTIAKLPTMPWKFDPKQIAELPIEVDLRGRRGLMHKTVSVETSHGSRILQVKAHIPDAPPGTPAAGQDRSRNMLIATVDRQAIFKNDCAECHTTPAAGKTGLALYNAACGICHEAEHRATVVPDLRTVNPTATKDFNYWRAWVAAGKPGSLMPAFAKAFGGPLDDAQIDSLAQLLAKGVPAPAPATTTTPAATPAYPAPAAVAPVR